MEMTVRKFVDDYKLLSSEDLKDKMIKSHIKCTYCPALKKYAILKVMLDKSITIQDNGIKYIDMFVNKINMIGTIIAIYTDLIIEKDEKGNAKIYEAYDLLKEYELLDKIYMIIGEKELNELISINTNVLDTFYNQNNTIESFVAKQVTRLGGLIGLISNSGLEKISETLNDENKVKILSSKLDKIIDKITKK